MELSGILTVQALCVLLWREGRARKEAREHMRGQYCFPRSFLLRLDPQLDSGLGNTGKTKTYSLDQLGGNRGS